MLRCEKDRRKLLAAGEECRLRIVFVCVLGGGARVCWAPGMLCRAAGLGLRVNSEVHVGTCIRQGHFVDGGGGLAATLTTHTGWTPTHALMLRSDKDRMRLLAAGQGGRDGGVRVCRQREYMGTCMLAMIRPARIVKQ